VAWSLAQPGCIMPLPPRPDAPLPDAGLDARSDAARLDARRDAPRDLGDVPLAFDPEWVVPPGVPADCRVERAAHPERLPGLTWESCGAGCSRALLGTVWNAVTAFRDGGRLWLELLSDDFGGSTRTDALAPQDGPILDAWRHVDSATTRCLMFNYEVGEGRAGAMVVYLGEGTSMLTEDRFWTYDLATGPAYVAADAMLGPPLIGGGRSHTQEFVVSPSLLAVRLGFGRVMAWYGGELREIFALTATQAGFDLGVYGDHLTFLDAGPARSLMQWTPERGTEVLYDPPEELADLRQHGTTLAWCRLMDWVSGLATRAELWTGELSRDPALFAPRLVNDRVEPGGVLGDGMYAWDQSLTSSTEAHLIDLDTGRHRILPGPPGNGCETLDVSRDEVVLACGWRASDGTVQRAIYLYDPDLWASDAPPT
jgi:hypothetical protein